MPGAPKQPALDLGALREQLVPKLCRLRLNHPAIFMNPGWIEQYDLQVDLVAPTKLTLTLGLQPSKELPPPTAGKTDRALGTQQETPTGSTESCKGSFEIGRASCRERV